MLGEILEPKNSIFSQVAERKSRDEQEKRQNEGILKSFIEKEETLMDKESEVAAKKMQEEKQIQEENLNLVHKKRGTKRLSQEAGKIENETEIEDDEENCSE